MNFYPRIPAENYLTKPYDESCYDYLIASYKRVARDLGDDYTAFVTPVGPVESSTSMKRLFSDIEKVAAFIDSKGIKKGDVMTAFLPTCGHAFIAFYSLIKLGVIANFVHPLTPPAQLDEIMQHTGSKGVFMLDLFAGAYSSIIEKYPTIVCSTSDFCDGVAYQYAKGNEMQNAKVPQHENVYIYKDILEMDLPAVPSIVAPYKDDAVYLHGGGTTGRSKTIIHSNYSMNFLAYAMYAYDSDHDHENCYSICALPCFHAYGLGVSMHYALCNAYRPIVIPKFDARQVNELIRKYRVVEFLGVPKMFQKMIEEDNFENEGVKNLLVLSVGGDFVSDEFISLFNAKIKKLGSVGKLGRGYGLTEMCAVCTSNTGIPDYKSHTVGRPIYGTTIEIWDSECNKLDTGEIGEVVITGETMMNRYLPDDVIKDTGIYTDKNGKKWIRTGDVGFLNAEGHLVFTSRIKRIIIISGYNIYPATIEEKVLDLDYINEVCACQGYDENGKPYVKLVVSLADKTLDEEEAKEKLMRFCQQKFEGYSVPRKIFVMDALPRTKMEKIDFVKLSDPLPR
ncbi:MAG: acyl--CoA ligase [Clostridia bacterium]|nr:acyl--CoA ligase [Clostridia bacterium]